MATLISIGQVLDSSLEYCRKHYKELLAIILWILVASIPSYIGKVLSPNGGDSSSLSGGDWVTFGLSIIGLVAVIVVSLWMYTTLILTVSDRANGKSTNLKELYRQGWKNFFRYLGLSLVIGFIILGLALVAVPGYALLLAGNIGNAPGILAMLGVPLFLIGTPLAIFLLAKYSVQLAYAPYILLLEKQSITAAIKGSINLIRGRWWATFIRFLLPKLIYFLVIFGISKGLAAVINILIAFFINTSSIAVLCLFTLSFFLQVFLSAVITPLIITTDYYLYDSLRKTQ